MRLNTQRDNMERGQEDFSRFLGLSCQRNEPKTMPRMKENGKSLAMVYPQKQSFVMIYDPEVALENGTMFEELNLPFYGGSCKRMNNGEGC